MNDAQHPTGEDAAESDFKLVVDELETAVRKSRRTASVVFAAAGGFTLAAVFYLLPRLNDLALAAITENSDSFYVFAYEMLRTTASAAVITAVVWGLFNLAKASLDQATRYEKRLIAARFLHFTLYAYADQIKGGAIKLPEIMAFLKAWSENVESAYTKVRFDSKGKDGFAIAVGPSGVAMTNDPRLTPPSPPGGSD